ncbi:uncharacterized protein TA11235 [Theileria annulata]|uniref:Uncharacterized protein n=1 Tax=Theileria annulata TaxID=5874 RepID=Q4U8J7_THEAN|nr:uncharacterized protein TA11235 [Theileria annulata]CAI76856.1 hypothetical protein TA11235 [Theileria annulata]|eukprot:XP_953481.1 hypothetical protein TA11235 [Theileria annulata]
MSQLLIKRNRILSSQSVDSQPSPSPDDIRGRLFIEGLDDLESESDIECVFKTSGFLKLLLLSINPSQTRNLPTSKISEGMGIQSNSSYYVHFVFKPEYLMIQSMMEGQSMYTCISISKEHLNKYTFMNNLPQNMNTVDVAVPLKPILICIGMYSQNSELSLSYNTEDKQIVLKGNCTDYDRFKYSSDVGQHLFCRLKTILASPLNIPFEDLFFNIEKYDYFTISPKILYSCIYDITTDSSSTRMILEVTPPTPNSPHVLGMTRENSVIIVQWDFSLDKNIFEDFKITKNHLYKYSTKCMHCVTNGLKISNKCKVMIKENGALLIRSYISWNISEEISLYYYVCPFVDKKLN